MKAADGFILMDFLKQAVKGWRRIVVCMIIGGLGGLLVSSFRSPIYETRAVIAVTIDYTRTGALSDIQEDQAMRGLGSVIDSDEVIKQVVLQAQQAGYQLEGNAVEESFSLEREDFRWFLRVRDGNARRAADLANIWAQTAVETLNQGMEHALIAAHLHQYLDSLEFCMQRQAGLGASVNTCEQYDYDYILAEVQSTANEIQHQNEMSYGLMPALGFFLAESAPLNEGAVQGTQGTLVIAGAAIGFIVAAVIPTKRYPQV